VPTVIVHSYLQKRIEALAARLEILMSHLLNAFHRNGGRVLYETEAARARRETAAVLSDPALEME